MMETDDFGHDPSVRSMRRVFAKIEGAQMKILGQIPPSRFDRRLRVWRESALRSFEEAWAEALRRGLVVTEEDIANLYILCFARVLEKGNVVVPRDALPGNEALCRFIRELIP